MQAREVAQGCVADFAPDLRYKGSASAVVPQLFAWCQVVMVVWSGTEIVKEKRSNKDPFKL